MNWIIIPTYNESLNIEHTIREVFKWSPNCRVLVVDGASTDDTQWIVFQLMKEFPNLVATREEKKCGIWGAYKVAIQEVLKDKDVQTITTMDADGSHDPREVQYLNNWFRVDGFIVGSRYVKHGLTIGWEKWRYLLSRFGCLYAQILTGSPIKDMTSGFVTYNAELLRKVNWSRISSTGYAGQITMKDYLIRELHASYKEMPITFRNRKEGESKMSWEIIKEGIKVPIKIFMWRLLQWFANGVGYVVDKLNKWRPEHE